MPDRGKVIEAFDDAKELVWLDDDEYTIGYNNGIEAGKNIALALLKEQEAKTVSHVRTVAYRTIGYCPSCGRGLDSYEDGNSGDHITHFCYNCGQAVKWE